MALERAPSPSVSSYCRPYGLRVPTNSPRKNISEAGHRRPSISPLSATKEVCGCAGRWCRHPPMHTTTAASAISRIYRMRVASWPHTCSSVRAPRHLLHRQFADLPPRQHLHRYGSSGIGRRERSLGARHDELAEFKNQWGQINIKVEQPVTRLPSHKSRRADYCTGFSKPLALHLVVL